MAARAPSHRTVASTVALLVVCVFVLAVHPEFSWGQDQIPLLPTEVQTNRWQRTTELPANILSMPAVATSTHVYVLGGSDSHDQHPTVYAASILENGSLGEWELMESLLGMRGYASAVLVGNTILLSGMTLQGAGFADSVEYSLVQTDGTLTPWQQGPPLITNRDGHAMATDGRFAYVIGGYNESAGPNNPLPIEYALVQDDGSLGQWSETVPNITPRMRPAAAYSNGFLYVVGGQTPTGWSKSVELIERAKVNLDGTLSEWVSLPPRFTAVDSPGVAVHDGRLLHFGGFTEAGSNVDTVQYATIETLGGLGPWISIQRLTARRSWFAWAQSGSRVYVLGGQGLFGNPQRSVEWIDLAHGLPPVIEDHRISIDEGELFTNQISVTLSMQAPSSTSEMLLSNDGGFFGATWEPFAESKSWTITQYGQSIIPRVVYSKFRAYDGVISSVFQDDIILDVTAPEGSVQVEPGSTQQAQFPGETVRMSTGLSNTVFLPTVACLSCRAPGMANVTLRLSAQDDASGVGQMLVSNSSTFAAATWEPYQRTKAWKVPAGGTTTVYVQFKDNAGNVSEAVTDAVTVP